MPTPAKMDPISGASLAQAQLPFTPEDFRQLAQILRQEVGVSLDEAKMPLLYARLASHVRGCGLDSFAAYCAFVATSEGDGERRRMINALTTKTTRFFREPHHFEHLGMHVLPGLIAHARKGKRVRLWSAGCSSGEEPYSLALTLLSAMPDAAQYDVKILATDIDSDVLDHGRRGIYQDTDVKAIPDELRSRWLIRRSGNGATPFWQVGPDMRALVAFRNLNLIGDWPMKGPFQVIFCRNTVIYFDEDARTQTWNRMAALLSQRGYLYVGHSERMPPGAEWLCPVGLTVFQRENITSDAGESIHHG